MQEQKYSNLNHVKPRWTNFNSRISMRVKVMRNELQRVTLTLMEITVIANLKVSGDDRHFRRNINNSHSAHGEKKQVVQ
jgi:hypothetical protein